MLGAVLGTWHAHRACDHGVEAARSMHVAMQGSVDEVGRAAAAEGIDCRFSKGGTVVAARTPAQVRRAEAEVAESRALGFGEQDLRWLGRAEAEERLRIAGMLGATYTPHCAVLDPARLVRGLAEAVERLGATLYEGTTVEEIRPRGTSKRATLRANGCSVTADVARPGNRGVGCNAARRAKDTAAGVFADDRHRSRSRPPSGRRRDWHGESFSDHRRLIIYGQRTADDRLAFGGRGAPYHFGSSVRPPTTAPHESTSRFAKRWWSSSQAPGTPRSPIRGVGRSGCPRDWFSSVGLDRTSGLAWAGGYVGDGVSTTNLAGRTLADLVLGRDSELVALPWVGHHSPRWEPEPLRWLGVNAALWATKSADRSEDAGGAPSALVARLLRALGRGEEGSNQKSPRQVYCWSLEMPKPE